MPSLDFFVVGEGVPVLLLHGWGQNKEMMMPLANKLKNKYKCIFIDMPGFGNSGFNNEIDIDEYCRTIHDFLLLKLHINPKYIVGHSFCGKVAVNYHLKYNLKGGIVLIASPILKPKRGIKYYFKIYIYKLLKKFRLNLNTGSSDYKNCNRKMKSFFVKVVNTNYNKKVDKIDVPVLMIYSKEDEKVEFNR